MRLFMRWLCVITCSMWPLLALSVNNMTIRVDEKDTSFTVSLPANPTTGYQWVIDSYDTKHFKSISSKYVGTAVKRMGSGGMMMFMFERKVDSPACTRMKFRYARPWEPHEGSLTQVTIKFTSPPQKNN